MAGIIRTYYRNWTNDDTTYTTDDVSVTIKSVETIGWDAPTAKIFKEWNTSRDGSGTAYDPGDVGPSNVTALYVIWEADPNLHELSITYENSQIAYLDASGTKTLLTQGTYCESNITVTYTKPIIPSASGVSF